MSAPPETLYESRLQGLPLLGRGKVRDLYAVGDHHLLIVATDRLSAFDLVLPDAIPGKGRVLTALSLFWFRHMQRLVASHLSGEGPEAALADPAERARVAGRAMLVRRLRPLPIEAVVRGYLAGSGWKDYQRSGCVCGIPLPPGLRQAERLPETLYTPSTKAGTGAHDENIDFEGSVALVGRDVARRVRELSIRVYEEAAAYARERGIIIADTKLEFGLDEQGQLYVIDELLTPDSSRFWPADAYRPGASPPSFDKQFVRDHLESIGWDKRPPAPRLPADIVARTAEKYREAERRLLA